MAFHVKEIYYTLQGEGAHAGRPAVFCRFAGCNLWTGRESDRASAKCYFCDTDFVGTDGPGGGTFRDAAALARALPGYWPAGARASRPYVVFTGGEPLLQLTSELLRVVKAEGFETAVETNGTLPALPELDWVTVSPKPASELVQRSGNELKLVFPHEVLPETVAELDFHNFDLSPLHTASSGETKRNLELAIDYCRLHPQWRLTMQYHKLWGIP